MQKKINESKKPYNLSIAPRDIEEIKLPIQLEIKGSIPKWLCGTFVRNGPGKFSVGEQSLTHWFDGFAFLVSFEFNRGKVLYRSSFIQSDQFKDSRATNQIHLNGFADRFGENEAQHISRDGQKVKTSNSNITIQKIGNSYVAFGETPLPIEFNLSALDTVGIFDYEDTLKKANSWESAHLKKDPKDGCLYNFYIDYGMVSNYIIYKIRKGNTKRELLAKKTILSPSYMHDFSITKNYVILTAYPLVVSPVDLLKPGNSFIGSHRWEPDRQTTIYVFNKNGGKVVRELKTEALFAFHHINAFENENSQVELYLSAAKNADSVIELGQFPRIYKGIELTKITIDLKKSLAHVERLSKNMYELPYIPEHLLGLKISYFYSLLFSTENKGFSLAKYDLKKKTHLVWFQENMFPGEPIFIPSPYGKSEDDGILLSIVYDAKLPQSFLLILDAKNMQEMARAKIPQIVPFGFHGKFFS